MRSTLITIFAVALLAAGAVPAAARADVSPNRLDVAAGAEPAPPACPDAVIPGLAVLPNAVGCWNAIAVQAVRLTTPYQVQGLAYVGYTQAAVYDAVTKIEGRYVAYDDFATPPGVDVADASPDAAAATAAYTMLTSSFLALPAAAQSGLATKYAGYLAALRGAGETGVDDGVKLGEAAASGLIAHRAGDRQESITFTPGPLTPGGWTFAPPPSVQSAMTPWLAVMKPFMLESPSQFRTDPPPRLSSRRWAKDYNEVKAYGAANSVLRSPAQTAVAKFWTAQAVNQSNQAFQDVAIAHEMDLVDAARLLAMGNLVESDAGIACWDSKFHHLFWRPIMAIRNAAIDGNSATEPDASWSPLLTTPNHPEYPAAHTCLSGAEAEVYASVLGTRHIAVTIHGSADGATNNWAATQTFESAGDLERQVADARVWAGLHYRGSAVAGLELAEDVARWALRRFFRPV